MADSYPSNRVIDEVYGIVYTFRNEKYGYTVYFNDLAYKDLLEDCKILSQGSYSFGFFKTDLFPEERQRLDPVIGLTMSEIVKDFFEKQGVNSVVLFHCDGSDRKGLFRHKTFSKWYRTSNIQEMVYMHQIEVEVEGQTHYLGFIAHNKNEHIQAIKTEFEDVAHKLTPESEKNRYSK